MSIRPEEINLLGKSFKKYITHERIQEAVKKVAEQINTDYAGQEVTFVSVLNGSFMFTGDLMKYITLPSQVLFIRAKSYHGMNSSGEVTLETDLKESLADRHVVLVEDIVDTGITINALCARLDAEKTASYKICSLLMKPEAYQGTRHIDYVAIEIPNEFIVGYGLDYDEYGRNLPDIYKIK